MKDNSTGKDKLSVTELGLSVILIYLRPFRDAENEYDQLTLLQAIYHAIIADTQPPEMFESSTQSFAKVGIVLKPGNSFKDSLRLDTVNRAQFLGRPCLPLNLIGGHTPEGGLRVPSGAQPGA